jgi:hypothetical protein
VDGPETNTPVAGPSAGASLAVGDAGRRDSEAVSEVLDESMDFEHSTGIPSEAEGTKEEPVIPRGEGAMKHPTGIISEVERAEGMKGESAILGGEEEASQGPARSEGLKQDGLETARRRVESDATVMPVAEPSILSETLEEQVGAGASAGPGRMGAGSEVSAAQGPKAPQGDGAGGGGVGSATNARLAADEASAVAAWARSGATASARPSAVPGGAGSATSTRAALPGAAAASGAADVRSVTDVAKGSMPPTDNGGLDDQPALGLTPREALPAANQSRITPPDEARREYESAVAQLERARAELEEVKAQVRRARAPPPPIVQGERGGLRGQLAKLDSQLDEVHGKIAEMMDRRDELTSRLARHYHRAPAKVGSSVFAPLLRAASAPAAHKAPWKAAGPTGRAKGVGAHRTASQAEDETEI